MQNLTMSLDEEEYDGTSDEEGSESDYSEDHVSQLRFLSGKKRKNDFEEVVNASIEPPPPLPQNYEARDFRQLTQPDGKGHLSTSVATTSARVGFKCRSVLVKFREPIEFDESSTDYDNAIRGFPDMMPTDYEKGCISFAHLRTYLDHTKVNIRDPTNAKTIFRAFMLLYFGGVVFGNSKSWARLKLLCPIAVLENKAYTIDFGSAILGHLYYCIDQASKQEVKYIGGIFQLIEYHCCEYCQIGHHILIDNRLDDFWPRMSAWQIKRRKVTGNKAKHHLALMRQQLDLRTINNMQWDPFRKMKDTLKREVITTSNISRKRVLLQCPFGRYEWYLEDRCWVQLEHRAVLYDPPEKLHCFPSSDVVCSLRVAGWIETQHYIVGHHIEYDAYWRHVSHGALMSDITRYKKSDIPGLGTLTSGVTFPRVEFPTADFSTQETQIPPPRLGDYPGWIMELGSPHGTTWHTIPSIASTSTIDVPTRYDFFAMTEGMRKLTLDMPLNFEVRHRHDERNITQLTENLRRAEDRLSQLNEYLDGESNGNMKRELLKQELYVGGVRGDGHLKVGPLLPDDQDEPGDLLFSVIWVLTGIVCLVLCSVV
ncbi:hypothetical protein GIB67_034841 [Kingdonia uniflora]|uniref:Aminotransferase-like plant mobile domain-containing protein n=1 Tax=Kingdonia uniflora TaxID=39325 RepID=A0A7J7MDX0_9MAGN|nr:hypothetical protein GIB67_034841 [Kingdonia uniflora]